MTDGCSREVDHRDGGDIEVTIEGAHAGDETDDVRQIQKQNSAESLHELEGTLRDGHQSRHDLTQQWAHATKDVAP